jgi:hypothetical protein
LFTSLLLTMAVICHRPGHSRAKGKENTFGLYADWKKRGKSAISIPAKTRETEESEPMVQYGGLISDDEDQDIERRAIESREGGQKFKVEYYIRV